MRPRPDGGRIGKRFLALPDRAPKLQRQSVGILALQLGCDHKPGRHSVIAGKKFGLDIERKPRTSRQRLSSIIRYTCRCGERFGSGSPPVCYHFNKLSFIKTLHSIQRKARLIHIYLLHNQNRLWYGFAFSKGSLVRLRRLAPNSQILFSQDHQKRSAD